MLHLGQEAQLDRNGGESRAIARARLLPHGDLDRDTPIAKLSRGCRCQTASVVSLDRRALRTPHRWREA